MEVLPPAGAIAGGIEPGRNLPQGLPLGAQQVCQHCGLLVNSRFGTVPPSNQAVLAAVGATTGQLIPYATGVSVYNRLGLTTQMPAVVTLASTRQRNLPRRLRTVVRPALEQVSDVPLLQWLEVGLLIAAGGQTRSKNK